MFTMSASYFLGLLLASFIASCGLTRFLISKSCLDIPNDRSSHTHPTPRGGGLAIVVIFFLSTFILKLPLLFVLPLILGGALIASIGFIDDLYSLSAKIRFFIQILAALIALYTFYSYWWAIPALLVVVWSMNLYNFMDGIDGLAGTQGIFVCLAGTSLAFYSHDYATVSLLLLLASCIAGFLIWNWAPAKIFMGDVGSCTLGFMIAFFTLHSSNPLFWIIIMAVFITDATLTLLKRIWGGEKWYIAHRKHLYQRLVQLGFSHQKVTLSMLLFNVCILLPLAWLSIWYPYEALSITVMLCASLYGWGIYRCEKIEN